MPWNNTYLLSARMLVCGVGSILSWVELHLGFVVTMVTCSALEASYSFGVSLGWTWYAGGFLSIFHLYHQLYTFPICLCLREDLAPTSCLSLRGRLLVGAYLPAGCLRWGFPHQWAFSHQWAYPSPSIGVLNRLCAGQFCAVAFFFLTFPQ